jgi:DNA-binding NtrC family response regulator
MYDNLKKTMKVHIVDDDQFSITLLEDFLLKKFGKKMQIKTFETGEACLAAIASEVPDVVILDYHLDSKTAGAANGLSILKNIKEHHEEVVVIMLSGQAKIDVAIETMRLGAKDYVVKGETASLHISQIIRNIIEVENQADELRGYKFGFWMAMGVIGLVVLGVLILYLFFPEYTKHLPL